MTEVMPRTRRRPDIRLKKLEAQVEDIAERQRLSRFDTVVLLLFPVILLMITTLTSAIVNYQTLTKFPIVGPLIDKNLPILLLILVFGLIVPFLAFLKAFLQDSLKGRTDACLLMVDYLAVGLWGFVQTVISPMVYSLLSAGYPTWITSILPGTFALSITLAIFYVWTGLTGSLAGRIARWLQENVPRKWKTQGLSAKNVPALKAEYLSYGKFMLALACGLYVSILVLAIARSGLDSVSSVHFGVLATLLVTLAAIDQEKRIRRLSKKASIIIQNYGTKHQTV